MIEDFEYPFPIVTKPATIWNRFQMMRLMWNVLNNKKLGDRAPWKRQIKAFALTFKFYFLTRRPEVAYRAD